MKEEKLILSENYDDLRVEKKILELINNKKYKIRHRKTEINLKYIYFSINRKLYCYVRIDNIIDSMRAYSCIFWKVDCTTFKFVSFEENTDIYRLYIGHVKGLIYLETFEIENILDDYLQSINFTITK